MDAICRMHERNRCGELTGTATELATLTRSTPEQFIGAARELRDRKAADIRFDGTIFYLRNRRMFIESERRKANADRQQRYRDSHGNDDVTAFDVAFERFWAAFPRGRKKSKAKARESFQKATGKADAETIIQAASEYAASEVARGRYVKMPETWLNQECWNDDRAAWCDLDKLDDPKHYRQVTREEFLEAVNGRKFNGIPVRSKTDEYHVYGMLTDGTRIECRNYWPKANNSANGAQIDT